MEQIKQHQNKLILAGGGVALFFLGIFLSKKRKSNKAAKLNLQQLDKKQEIPKSSPLKTTNYQDESKIQENDIEIYEKSEYPQIQSKDELLQFLNHLKGKKVLSIDDILELYDKAIILMKEDYQQLTNANRKKRRDFDFQDQKYFDLIFEYVLGIEDLMNKYVSQLLESLQITQEIFQKSLNKIIQQNEQYAAILFITREKIKLQKQFFKLFYFREFLTIKIKVPLDKAKELFKFQLKLLTSKSYLFKNLFKKNFSKQTNYQQQLIISAITIILFDYVYEEFSIEEEDLMNLQGFSNYIKFLKLETQRDIDLLKIFQEIQTAMNQLLLEQFH